MFLHRHSLKTLRQSSFRQPLRSFTHSICRHDFRATPLPLARQNPSPNHKIPPFREELARTGQDPPFVEVAGKPGIRNQVLFFLVGSALVFSYAAIETNLETDIWIRKLSSSTLGWTTAVTNLDIKRAQNAEVIKKLRDWYSSIVVATSQVPNLIRPWAGVLFVSVMQPYADASEGKRLCWKICLFNAAVWLAWKAKRYQGAMQRSFMHHPLSGLSYTLLTSMFSHKSFIHLAFNCLALESFGSAAYYYLLKEEDKASPQQLESTSAYHFLAFYVSAGVFSGLVSHVAAAKFHYPRIVAQLTSAANCAKKTDTWAAAVAATQATAKTATKAVPEILPSLGASGAIYGCVTLTALAFPESQVALFIPPSYPISIQYGVGGLLLLDTIGIIRGWRMFDHWAHLGGAAFGVAYYAYGPWFWTNLKRTFTPPADQSTHSGHT